MYQAYNKTTEECECQPTLTYIDGSTCSCDPGKAFMGSSGCELCELGKWKADVGVKGCFSCEVKGATTPKLGALHENDCLCPKGTYENLNKECVDVIDGMSEKTLGMTLSTADIDPGYWRTNAMSTDVRECPIPKACHGGNSTTDYCFEGHEGPYCGVCSGGYFQDPFGLCQSCNATTKNVILTFVTLVATVLALYAVFMAIKKRKREKEEGSAESATDPTTTTNNTSTTTSNNNNNLTFTKRFKNGFKIIFSGAQIATTLPTVIPMITFPPTFKTIVNTAATVFRADLFSFVPFSCLTNGGFNYYTHLLLSAH
ncbi:hypothetical protein TrVE_jg12525 [Triparma verrucosa]|uniref:Tyrosine-protein kinase ephrin type A/B receptor-like domain-containing protein n=1 Tax=Triparma verrucosa TaxID=1606542 RepID=A0A9W7KUA5_9STRA|nr:hypothetical protein TrVE_jg12525 [Triparma verrucosa]